MCAPSAWMGQFSATHHPSFPPPPRPGTIHSYGLFVQNIINFLLVSIIVFFLVKAYTTAFRKPKPPKKRECPTCMKENHVLARRCAFCTSDIPKVEEQEDGKGEEGACGDQEGPGPDSPVASKAVKRKRPKP